MNEPSGAETGFPGFEPPEADQHHSLEDLLVWRYELAETASVALPPNGVNPNPLVVRDIVIASVFSPGEIVAVARETGGELWNLHLQELGSSHVSFADGVLYAKTSRTLYALKLDSGEVIWKWTPYDVEGEWVYSSPTLEGDRLFIGDRAGVLHCLSTKTGDLLWWAQTSEAENRDVNATAIVVDDLVITATNAALAIAYEVDSGREVWRRTLDSGSMWQIQRLRDNIVVQTWNSIYLLDPGTGEIGHQWSWPGRQVQWITVAQDGLLAITYKDSGKDCAFAFQEQRLLGLGEDGIRFEHEYSALMVMLRYEPTTKLVYESRFDGLGIIDPNTGRRLHHISSKQGFHPTLPHISEGIIYLLADETHIDQDGNGEPSIRRLGVLLAVRHP
ncbi:MAG: PQQ-binding-like beta-propeller repeat protein [Phycisphaerales bacterium]